MIKLFASVIILACAFLFGEFIYRNYLKRERHLCALLEIVSSSIVHITHSPSTIDELFMHFEGPSFTPYNTVFTHIHKQLKKGTEDFSVLYRRILTAEKNTFALKDSEFDLLVRFGDILQKTHRQDILSLLDILREDVAKAVKKAGMDAEHNGKMYRKLSIFSGIFIVIVLM